MAHKLHTSVAVKVTFADPVSPHSSDSTTRSLLQVTAPYTSDAEAPPLEFNQLFSSMMFSAPQHEGRHQRMGAQG